MAETALKRMPSPVFSCEQILRIQFFWFISLNHPFGHVLQNRPFFRKLTGNYLTQKFFLEKVAHHQACKFIEKRLQHRCFTMNFTKLLKALCRTPPVSASDASSTFLTLRPCKTHIYVFVALLFSGYFQATLCFLQKSGTNLFGSTLNFQSNKLHF